MQHSAGMRLLALLACLPLSCAIPVLPAGGPVDKEPPTVVKAAPANESVNVQTERIVLAFSEYIDQASFAQSVSINPAFDRPLQYRWKRREVEITFPEALRENTTYILSIDTELRDANRVALTEPITLAFATGPVINRGRLAGRVADAQDGAGLASFDVYAYAMPDSSLPAQLPDSPDYRTQTDQNGAFAFEYLSEQPYFVVAIQDRNRNRKHDGIEPFAVPPEPFFFADSSASASRGDWLVTATDTIPPEIQRIRSLSSRRFSLRFSESIQLLSRDPQNWTLRDSVSNQVFPVEDLYLYEEDPRMMYMVAGPLFASRHGLVAGGIADSSGNAIAPIELFFTPSTTTDTLQTRFLGFRLETGASTGVQPVQLSPGKHPELRFNQPVSDSLILQHVTATDSSGQEAVIAPASASGSVYTLQIPPDFSAGAPFTVRVRGAGFGAPDTTYERAFVRLTAADLGELSGFVASADTTGQPVVQLYPADNPASSEVFTAAADTSGRFLFGNLPAGQPFRFRAFMDRNENFRWDGGQILPYVDAEPITWHADSLQVRARWEQTLADTLRIPSR